MPDKFNIDGVGMVGTGLLVPEERVTTFATFESAVPLWTDEEIESTIRPGGSRQVFDSRWVYSQGEIGSCNGFAGAQCMERVRFLRGLPRVKLSGVGLYAAINGRPSRDRGSMLDDAMSWLLENGCPPDDLVPQYEWRYRNIPPAAWEAAQYYKAHKAYGIDTERGLATAIAGRFPCVVAVQAGQGSIDADGVSLWGNGAGNHAVLVDGLRKRRGIWEFDMCNSWGSQWGQNGRAWLQWDRHLSGPNRNHYFYAIRGAVGHA